MLPHSPLPLYVNLSGGLRSLAGFCLIGTLLVLRFGTVAGLEVATLAGAWLINISESEFKFSGGYDTKADASGFSAESDVVFSVVVAFLRILLKCRLIHE